MTIAENAELGANLAGVIKAIVRSELSAREERQDEDFKSRVGRPWTAEEDQQLEKELIAATAILGSIHRRNHGGIIARIRQIIEHTIDLNH